MVFLFGIITIIQSNLAYATSSEKIPLVQKFEQFPGQEITGFCYLQIDDEGNLDWRIKVNGLVPKIRGFFDLGHWAGEVDVPFIADDDGKADSKNQIVLAEDFPHSLVSQFAKCKVYTTGYNHFTSPLIALGVPGSGNEDANENKNLIPPEKKSPEKNPSVIGVSNSNSADVDERKITIPIEKRFFLFYSLDYVIGILKNNNLDAFAGFNSVFGPPPPPTNNLSNSNAVTVSIDFNEHSKEISSGNHPIKAEKNSTKINPKVTVFKEGKGTSDKGTSDKGTSDKGTSDKGTSDKGTSDKGTSDKGTSDKGTSDKGTSDKGTSDKGNGDNGGDPKRCNTGQKKKGSC